MRRLQLLAVGAAGLLILGFTAMATPTQEAGNQAAAVPDSGQTIGLLDVGYVMKNYPRFAESLAELKTDVQAAEEEVKRTRDSLAGMQQQLGLLTVGTPEYAELERRITMSQAELAGSVEAQKKEFVRREGRLYHDVYRQIVQVVEDYARANHVSVVLRFSDDPVNANNPKEVLQQLNRPIVWHDRGRDLTRIILQRLIQASKQPEGNGGVPPKEPVKPEEENDHGESQRASHLG